MASTKLTKTFSSTGNRTKFTTSFWIKRSKLGGQQPLFSSDLDNTNNYYTMFYLDSGDGIGFFNTDGGSSNVNYLTNRKLRDTNAWYHIVIVFDSTQSGGNRIKFYINGERETSFANSTEPNQNADNTWFNRTYEHMIGTRSYDSSTYFDGLMSHFHFIDGTAYDASAFGETDTTTGEWKAKTSPSVTYGTNGFFILKDGNSVTDQSGNSNNWTVGGGTLTDLKDNPDNVFATYNSLTRLGDYNILSNGNTTQKETSGVGQRQAICNIGNITGKFYAEFKMINLGPQDGSSPYCGVLSMDNYVYNTYLGNNGIAMHPGGNVYKSASVIDNQTSITYTTNSIVSVALDITNNKCHFRVNGGTWLASGDPANNTGGYDISSLNTGDALTFASSVYNNNCQWSANFGNGFFGTTAITTNSGNGYSGAEGSSKFNYTVPTGYSALSTKGLNE